MIALSLHRKSKQAALTAIKSRRRTDIHLLSFQRTDSLWMPDIFWNLSNNYLTTVKYISLSGKSERDVYKKREQRSMIA